MIKASQINDLLEEWVRTNSTTVEVIENPVSWREAARQLKDELEDVVNIHKVAPVFRFSYNRVSEDLKVWVAYYAIHHQVCGVLSDEEFSQTVSGFIDVKKRTSRAFPSQNLPKKLRLFLRGTEIGGRISDIY